MVPFLLRRIYDVTSVRHKQEDMQGCEHFIYILKE